MASPVSQRVVVVGGGISGLACLWRLVAAGVDAELVERTGRLGGLVRTERRDGFLIEAGPSTVIGYPDLLDLARDAGLGDEIVRADGSRPRFVYFDGRLQRAPLGPGTLVGTRLLSLRGKLRLFCEPFVRDRSEGEESIRDFFTRRFGRELHDVLVAPIISGIFAGDTTRLSIDAVFPRLADLERRYGSVVTGFFRDRSKRDARESGRQTLVSFRDGLEALPARIGERLAPRIRRGAEVELIRRTPTGFEVALRDTAISATAVILATPADTAARLLAPVAPIATDSLSGIESPSLASVSLGYRRSDLGVSPGGFGFLAPRGQGLRLLGSIFVSSLFPGRAPEGEVALTSFVGGATDPDAAALGEDELVELVDRDLARALGTRAHPKVLGVHRYRQAIPQYTLGHRLRIAAIEEALATAPGLFVTGNFLDGVSVGDCVRRAKGTAETVMRFLEERRRTAAHESTAA